MRARAFLLASILLAGCVGTGAPPEDPHPGRGSDASPPTPTPTPTPEPPPPPAGPSKVEVVDGALHVNGSKFHVRGVTYSPVPVGWREGLGWVHVPEIYGTDLPLIRAMGANALRLVLAPVDVVAGLAFLDAASANGLHVLLGVPGPAREDAGDPKVRARTLDAVKALVTAYKDHPAVLLWVIGNEVNYRYPGKDVKDWYTLLEEAAKLARDLDPHHAVATANSDLLDIDLFMKHAPTVEVFGTNHYNYAPGHYAWFMREAARRAPGKAILVTEFGVDALDARTGKEDEGAQARLLMEHLREIEAAPRSAGVVVFEWVDEWWKVGSRDEHDATADWEPHGGDRLPDGSASEEWFGLVRQKPGTFERETREAYHALAREWSPSTS